MSTIYVAGPMTGLPEFNYPTFEAAEATLSALGYRVSLARRTSGTRRGGSSRRSARRDTAQRLTKGDDPR